ncbi:hypothetical protein XENTR_v10010844 [Xenopus tropicalis]|nr:hypothetical protein XENTR_v10010844 [Xenopus tropicalis]
MNEVSNRAAYSGMGCYDFSEGWAVNCPSRGQLTTVCRRPMNEVSNCAAYSGMECYDLSEGWAVNCPSRGN